MEHSGSCSDCLQTRASMVAWEYQNSIPEWEVNNDVRSFPSFLFLFFSSFFFTLSFSLSFLFIYQEKIKCICKKIADLLPNSLGINRKSVSGTKEGILSVPRAMVTPACGSCGAWHSGLHLTHTAGLRARSKKGKTCMGMVRQSQPSIKEGCVCVSNVWEVQNVIVKTLTKKFKADRNENKWVSAISNKDLEREHELSLTMWSREWWAESFFLRSCSSILPSEEESNHGGDKSALAFKSKPQSQGGVTCS